MRCPLKEDNFGRMPECQPDCAWLVKVTKWDDFELRDIEIGCMCAVTAGAISNYHVQAVNVTEVGDE